MSKNEFDVVTLMNSLYGVRTIITKILCTTLTMKSEHYCALVIRLELSAKLCALCVRN